MLFCSAAVTATKTLLLSRVNEVDMFLDLVSIADAPASNIFVAASNRPISDAEKNIFRATVLLLLYNTLEAVCRSIIVELRSQIVASGINYKSATPHIRHAWVLSEWKDRRSVNPVNAVKVIEDILEKSHNRTPLEINVDGLIESLSGNISIGVILEIGVRFGFDAKPRTSLQTGTEIERVKHQRNQLGHGNKSFVECGRDFSPTELTKLRTAVGDTLDDLIVAVEAYISSKGYKN